MKKFLTEEQAAVRGGMQRRAKAGTYTVILSLIVLAILIAVNLLVAALPSPKPPKRRRARCVRT